MKLGIGMKGLTIVSSVVLAASGLVGTSVAQASSSNVPSNTIPTNKNFDIKIVSWQDPKGQYGEAYNYAVQLYMKLHPNVKIENIYQPLTGGGYTQLLDTEFVAHDAPDAMQLFSGDIAKYTNEGYLLLLDGYMHTKSPYSSTQWVDSFINGNQAFGDIKALNKYGAISFVPVDGGPGQNPIFPFFYNKDILQKSGVTQLPQTWAQFMAVCQKIQQHGYVPVEADNNRWLNWIMSWTGSQMGNGYLKSFFEPKYGSYSLYSDQATVALLTGKIGAKDPVENDEFSIIQNFSKYWEPGWAGITTDEAEQAFVYGKSAFILDGNFVYQYMKQNAKFNLGLLPFPLITSQTTKYAAGGMPVAYNQDGYGWGLNNDLQKDPAKLKVVLDIFQFMTSRPIQTSMAKIGMFAPVAKGVPASPDLKPFMATSKDNLVDVLDNPMYNNANNAQALTQEWLTGGITRTQFMTKLHQDNMKYVKQAARDALDSKIGLPNQIKTLETTLAQEKANNSPPAVIQATQQSLQLSELRLEFYKQYALPVLGK